MQNLFDADPENIATLDSKTLVVLMKRLLLSESRLIGIPLRSATIPLQITVPDGGEDGRVEWDGGHAGTNYLPCRFNIFQSKAQNLTDAIVRSEILKKPKKGKTELSPAIIEALDRNGSYIIFCSKPFTTSKIKKLTGEIRKAIKEGGGDPTKASAIEVYDANAISNWVNSHPSVALWLASQRLGKTLDHFQSYDGWSKDHSITAVPWQDSNEPRFVPTKDVPTTERVDPLRGSWTQKQAIEACRAHLAKDQAVVRIAGPSGFGKTRFAFEIFRDASDLATQIDAAGVLYVDGSLAATESIALALQLADARAPAILVVDECPDELHNKLAERVRRAGSTLRLITIDIETRIIQVEGTLTIRLEKTDDVHTRAIAKAVRPTLTDSDISFIAELADGFPRMAVIAAEQKGDGRQTFESAEQVLIRLIWGGRQQDNAAQVVLEIASLFDWFGVQGRVQEQADFIARELASMPLTDFVSHLRSFRGRGIFSERGDFAQVGPLPLAARLAIARLGVMDQDQLANFFQRAPHHVKISFLKRLRWLDTSPTAKAFARNLLSENALGNLASLNTGFGSRCLEYLTNVDPDLVSETIERVFGYLTFDELRAAKDGRRHLIWSLQKLAFRKESFDRSARMLRRLAVAEIEEWANNATGQFKQLFQLHLSGTEAEPEARLLVIDDGLASNEPREREVCVEALDQMLTVGHFTRAGGSERIGSRERLEDWRPRTIGQMRDFYRSAVTRLVHVAGDGSDASERAKMALSSHVRGLLQVLGVGEVRKYLEDVIAICGFWPEALYAISAWIYFDGKDSTDLPEVQKLFNEMLPSDPIELAILYTNGWALDLHDPGTHYDDSPTAKHDFEYASRKAQEVATIIASNASLLDAATERFAVGDGRSVYPFARRLGALVTDPLSIFMKAIASIEQFGSPPNRGFLSGLINAADERDPAIAREMIASALRSEKLRAEAIGLIGSGKLTKSDVLLVASLIRSGDIPMSQVPELSYGRGLDHMAQEDLIPLLLELEKHAPEGLWALLNITLMYLYGGTKIMKRPLIKLIQRTLTAPRLMTMTTRKTDGYHLEEIVKHLARSKSLSEAFIKKFSINLLSVCSSSSSHMFYDLDSYIRKIFSIFVEINPILIWNLIAINLMSPSWEIRHYTNLLLSDSFSDENHLTRAISIPIPEAVILKWIRDDPNQRAAMAVDWISLAVKDGDGALHWTPDFAAFVDEFGSVAGVLDEASGRLRPNSTWGSRAPYLEPVVPLLASWRTHSNSDVRRWVSTQIDQLNREIAHARKQDEEDIVRFS